MKKKLLCAVACALSGFSLLAQASDLEPSTNLDLLKSQIIRYHESGAYQYDIKKIADQAQMYLEEVVKRNKASKEPKKLAIVLDIDETALSNYQNLKKIDFSDSPKIQTDEEDRATDPAIQPTLKLYRYALDHDVTVFFVTGRAEPSRKPTIHNLLEVGYTTVKDSTDNCENKPVSSSCLLYLRDGKYLKGSAIPYKTAMRKKIEQAGYTIVENIGDQYSDLAGGHSQRTYKYPDNMYYIP